MNLKQLSSHLNLSPTTVSRALGGYSDVSEHTRERVRRAAHDLDYRPSRVAQQLRVGRADAVGLVLPVPPEQFASPLFGEMIAGMGEELAHDDQALVVTSCPPGPHETAHYQRQIRSGRVDGFIVLRTRKRDVRAELLQEAGVPFVMHGRSESAPQAAFLDIDSERGFAEAARLLLGLGHRRIALINGPAELYSAAVRQRGFVQAMQDAGVTVDHTLIRNGDLDEASGHSLGLELLGGTQRPTAIVCVNDMTALGVIHAARELNLRVGDDLSVTGYDDIPIARYSDPALTTLGTSARQAGRRLVQLHRELLKGTPPEQLQELWTPELILRRSHGPVQT